jgi:hypothetical protein
MTAQVPEARDRDEDSVLDREISGGWVAALQHHFVAAVVPPAGKAGTA